MSVRIAERKIQRKLKVLTRAIDSRNVSKTCRYFGVSRDTVYEWKRAFKTPGELGLVSPQARPPQ